MKKRNKIMDENKSQKKTISKQMTRQQKLLATKERKHLTWKEKNREKALRRKLLRRGLTKEERLEWDDLKFVEVIAEGRNFMTKEEFEKKLTPEQERTKERRWEHRERTKELREYTKEYRKIQERKQKYKKEYRKRMKEQKQKV